MTIKSYKSPVILLAAISFFLCTNNYFVFQYQNRFSQFAQDVTFKFMATAKANYSVVTMPKKGKQLIHMAVLKQQPAPTSFLALGPAFNGIDQFKIIQYVHPFSARAPPTQS
uniref:Uncharacterized protein n=1 Tax=uncultured Desulfobacterium sp. TaxID=201089 RepID=E1Y8S8_9BACT|nr:unknown protein [uncultured Desulfobacterium sp.]